jgi:hypothetical protein
MRPGSNDFPVVPSRPFIVCISPLRWRRSPASLLRNPLGQQVAGPCGPYIEDEAFPPSSEPSLVSHIAACWYFLPRSEKGWRPVASGFSKKEEARAGIGLCLFRKPAHGGGDSVSGLEE